MLGWVDEACWIAASLDFPHCKFVTVGMDKVEFHHGVTEGVILEIDCERAAKGETSVTYSVEVYRGRGGDEDAIFSTQITFVNMNESGEKQAI